MPSPKRIALVIPAYNEQVSIGAVITDLQKVLKKNKLTATIIVVDDGSQDETAKISEAGGAYVIRHVLNSGSGSATATGLSFAQQQGYDIAATLDADGQHKASDVIEGLRVIQKNGADLLIGSRLINASGMSKTKVLGNRGLSTITRILFGISVTDSQSGLRIFSRNALNRLRWKTSGFEFCSEMLWRARQANLIVDEYPIKAVYTEYSKSKGQNNWNGFNIVKSLVERRFMELFGE
jgi:glycosyltransferase involved in cell wall biosynthesis